MLTYLNIYLVYSCCIHALSKWSLWEHFYMILKYITLKLNSINRIMLVSIDLLKQRLQINISNSGRLFGMRGCWISRHFITIVCVIILPCWRENIFIIDCSNWTNYTEISLWDMCRQTLLCVGASFNCGIYLMGQRVAIVFCINYIKRLLSIKWNTGTQRNLIC